VTRFHARFPGVAPFNIVGPGDCADVESDESNNFEDGTLRRTRLVSARASKTQNSKLKTVSGLLA
jgi:hypothetical protein